MATIHKRKTGGGDVVWELTHGTGRDRQRFVAGRTKQEAEGVLAQFTRQIALHGEAPDNVTVADAVARYVEYLGTNRRKSTQRRYGRVLQTFDRCFLKVFHYGVSALRDVRPAHVEDYKERRLGARFASPPHARRSCGTPRCANAFRPIPRARRGRTTPRTGGWAARGYG